MTRKGSIIARHMVPEVHLAQPCVDCGGVALPNLPHASVEGRCGARCKTCAALTVLAGDDSRWSRRICPDAAVFVPPRGRVLLDEDRNGRGWRYWLSDSIIVGYFSCRAAAYFHARRCGHTP